ncbi:hypothetical protein M5E87_22115 [Flavonifractor plautii]|nr:hypothetical protein M5E87_22115 [Flavonifractor plautii]
MRRAAEAWRISGDGLIPVLAVTAACFLLGGLVGCLLASHIGGGGQESLAAYVEGFLRAAQAGRLQRLRWPHWCGTPCAGRCWHCCWASLRWGFSGCHFCLWYGDFCWPFRLPHLCACSAAWAVCWPFWSLG